MKSPRYIVNTVQRIKIYQQHIIGVGLYTTRNGSMPTNTLNKQNGAQCLEKSNDVDLVCQNN